MFDMAAFSALGYLWLVLVLTSPPQSQTHVSDFKPQTDNRWVFRPLSVATETNPGIRLTLRSKITPAFGVIQSLPMNQSSQHLWVADYDLDKNFAVRYIQQEDGSYTSAVRHHFQLGTGLLQNYSLLSGLRFDNEQHLQGEMQLSNANFLRTHHSLLAYGRVDQHVSFFQLGTDSDSFLGTHSSGLISTSYETEGSLRVLTVTIQEKFHVHGPMFLLGDLHFKKLATAIPNVFTGESNAVSIFIPKAILTLYADTRDNPGNPKRGIFFSYELEGSPSLLKSDLPMIKTYTQFFCYHSVKRIELASGVRLGFANAEGILIHSERFFAGGSNTIRGFDTDQIGPRSIFTDYPAGGEAVLILNEEARAPIYGWLKGVVFLDVGNVYAQWQHFDFKDLRYSAGLGLRLDSPYGLFRADLGRNLDPKPGETHFIWHFGLGQAF